MLQPASFDDCYRATYAPLVRLSSATTGSVPSAEEIVQDVFASAYQQWDSIEIPERWLYRAVANKSVSWVRRRIVERRWVPTLVEQHAPDGAGTASVREALRRLPANHRAVVFLRYYEDLSELEIADRLGCAVGTVKSRLGRARESLRKDLA